MANLKALRTRINSVRSTRKITSAMKMVAAAKLRHAQESAEAARPYAERMARMMASLAGAFAGREDAPRLLAGTGSDKVNLIVVVTSDRGLCGGFNASVVRSVRQRIAKLQKEGREVQAPLSRTQGPRPVAARSWGTDRRYPAGPRQGILLWHRAGRRGTDHGHVRGR